MLDSETRIRELVHGLWQQDGASEAVLSLSVPPTGYNATIDAKLVRQTF